MADERWSSRPGFLLATVVGGRLGVDLMETDDGDVCHQVDSAVAFESPNAAVPDVPARIDLLERRVERGD